MIFVPSVHSLNIWHFYEHWPKFQLPAPDTLPKGFSDQHNPLCPCVGKASSARELMAPWKHPWPMTSKNGCINTSTLSSLEWDNSEAHVWHCFMEFLSRIKFQLPSVVTRVWFILCLLPSFPVSLPHFPISVSLNHLPNKLLTLESLLQGWLLEEPNLKHFSILFQHFLAFA